jgi:hypothetical protein
MPKCNERIPIYEDGQLPNCRYYTTTHPIPHPKGCDITVYGNFKIIPYSTSPDKNGIQIINMAGETVAILWGYEFMSNPEFTIKLKGDFTVLELQKIMGSLTKTQSVTVTKEE